VLRCGSELHGKMCQLRERYSVSTVVKVMLAYTASLLHSLVSERRLSRRDGVAYCREFTAQALSGPLSVPRLNRGKADRARVSIREGRKTHGDA
jgi:hypothetical protein